MGPTVNWKGLPVDRKQGGCYIMLWQLILAFDQLHFSIINMHYQQMLGFHRTKFSIIIIYNQLMEGFHRIKFSIDQHHALPANVTISPHEVQ